MINTPRPKHRSRLRLWLGKNYHTIKRYGLWWFGGIRFGKIRMERLPFEIAAHTTPMLRKLKDVDMYLQHNKVTNLRLASARVSGITLQPGETFSYWKAIGRTTKKKGYLDGMILRNGGFYSGVGGGLCQMSNLIYWMTIHTPLTVIERHRHGYDVFPDSNRTQPFGSGATCFYNYGDLMIRNDTDRTYQLLVRTEGDKLKGQWLCDAPADCRYEVYEKEHRILPEFWGGYTRHNLLYRKKFDLSGNYLDDEYVVENHAIMMYAPLLSDGV